LVAAGNSLLLRAAIRRPRRNPGGDRLAGARLKEQDGEVLRFMTAGLSKLVVGVETVKTHVGDVLTKFGARDRHPRRDRGVRVRFRHAHTVIGVRGTRVSDGSGT
jgi:hypothetical protein